MKYQLIAPYIILFAALSSCSLVNEKPDLEALDQAKMVKSAPPTLCKYTTRKGIAELISIEKDTAKLLFYPGNIEFSMTQRDFNTTATKGQEFKAIYEELIQGSSHCPITPPQLVGLPH